MKSWLVGLSALAGLCTAPAVAGTIVQTQGATLIDVGRSFSVPLEFNQFNPSLGTLDGVTLDLSAFFSGTVGIENISTLPDVAHGIIAGTVSAATSDASLSAEVFPSAVGPSHDFTAFDGTLDFAGTSAVGEPASASILMVGLLGLWRRRRR